MLHARVLRQPWRGATLADFDEAAVRRAAGAPIDIVRDGDFVAFTSDDEVAVMRAAQAARGLAVWTGGARPPSDAGEPDWLKRPARARRIVETGAVAGAAGNRVVEASFSRPFLTYGSIGPSCALAEFKDGALKVWTHSQGRVRAARMARACAAHRSRAGHGLPPARAPAAYGHNTADDAAFDAAFIAMRNAEPHRASAMVARGRVLGRADGLGHGDRAARGARCQSRPADWTIEIWSPAHAQRPGMNGNANLLGAEALPDAPSPPAEINDVRTSAGGGATRNAQALYDLPRHQLVHHLLPHVPMRTSSLRGLGALANVFAIESFMDELAETAGEDPVGYRLSLMSDPRARRVIETAAEMSGLVRHQPRTTVAPGASALPATRTAPPIAAVVAEVEVDEQVRLKRVWAAVDAGLVINPDGAANQIEGGIIQGASWILKEGVRFEDGRVASDSWESYPILHFSEVPEIDIRFIEARQRADAGFGRSLGRPDRGGDRQCGGARAGQTHPRPAADA